MTNKVTYVLIAILCSLIIIIPIFMWGLKYIWAYALVAYTVQYFLQKNFFQNNDREIFESEL